MSARLPYIPKGITHQGRLTEADLDRRIAEKAEPTEAASCCSELLESDDKPRARMGGLRGWERAVLFRRPTHTVAAVVLFAVFAAIVRSLP